jgi:hypothetical protein
VTGRYLMETDRFPSGRPSIDLLKNPARSQPINFLDKHPIKALLAA